MKLLLECMRNRPQLYATLVASGVVVAILLASVFMIYQLEHGEVSDTFDAAARDIGDVRQEVERAFFRLDNSKTLACNEVSLLRLRALLYDYRYIRDVGLYDADGRLYCSSGLGRLAKPVIDPPTLMVSPEGQMLWLNMPLLMTNGGTEATIVRRGRFNLVIDPFFTRQIRSSGVDAIWYLSGSRYSSAMLDPGIAPELNEVMRRAANSLTSEYEVEWARRHVIFTFSLPGTTFVLQIARSPGEILWRWHKLVLALSLFVLAIGPLTYLALVPVMRRANSLKSRIDRLCTERHIHCLYQPIVDLATGVPVGCEVLMRLRDGQNIILPDIAIPAIMARGLTWELDRLVSQKALGELERALPTRGPFKVAFNFFPENLAHPEFKPHLENLRDRSGNRFALNIEVTEYSFAPESIEVLHQLKDEGFLISVDDFGTGYSNLGTVKRVAPNFLKIDKSFVFEMEDASLRSNLIPEIVAIARAVGAEVIGEGVETQRQANALAAQGVRFGQGYHFARPMPINEFVSYLNSALRYGIPHASTGTSSSMCRITATEFHVPGQGVS